MEHTAKTGAHKILSACNLPLTGVFIFSLDYMYMFCLRRCDTTPLIFQSRVFLSSPLSSLSDMCILSGKQVVDLIITELAVFTVDDNGLTLIEHAEGVSVEDIKVIKPIFVMR